MKILKTETRQLHKTQLNSARGGTDKCLSIESAPNDITNMHEVLPYIILGVYAIWDSIISCIY